MVKDWNQNMKHVDLQAIELDWPQGGSNLQAT
jgi:hypothetical protein